MAAAMYKRLPILVASAIMAGLTACATPSMQRMARDQQQDVLTASAAHQSMRKQQDEYFQEVDLVWIGGNESIAITKGDTQPRALDAPVVFQRNYPVTLQMVAEWVSSTVAVPVTVTGDATVSAAEVNYDPTAYLAQREEQGHVRQAQPLQKDAKDAAAGAFFVQYQGPLRGLLDEVAARTGNAWVWRDGRVVILNTDTRIFQLHALPGTSTVSATVTNQSSAGESGGGGAGGGGGGAGGAGGAGQSGMNQTNASGQATTMETTIEAFDTVTTTVKAMLSAKGKVAAGGSTGAIAVTDTPAVLDRVGAYITALNAQLTRQVVIDVKVYSVDVTNTESYGINWQLVWQSLAGNYQISTSLGGQTNPAAGGVSLGVIDESSQWAGSQMLLKALSQQGDVSIKTSAAVATLSNQPVPVQVAEETSYLAQAQSNLVANAGSSTTLTPGKVVTGFSMNLLPVVLTGNEVLLQMQINLSNLRGIREITSAGTRIEVPDVDARHFLQRVKLTSGSTLVLGGFEQEQVTTSNQGIGDPRFTLLGGSRNGSRKRTVMVVTLTPRVVG